MNDVFVGKSKEIVDIFDKIELVSKENLPVIIYGETGTGKEVVARIIHAKSCEENSPFCAVQCASVNETLAESELFGHEKGAFTGAYGKRKGKFEYAENGTLLLDDIDTLNIGIQAKILRAVENHSFERVGGNESVTTKCRIISTTNKNLLHEIRDCKFREDLYYRLCIFPISIPPLRERREDIAELVDYFVEKYCNDSGKVRFQIDSSSMDILVNYNWPGNVRQLQNIIRQNIVLSNGSTVLKARQLRNLTPEKNSPNSASKSSGDSSSYQLFDVATKENGGKIPDLHTLKTMYIRDLLELNNNNFALVAELLGVGRSTLYRYSDKEESVL